MLFSLQAAAVAVAVAVAVAALEEAEQLTFTMSMRTSLLLRQPSSALQQSSMALGT